PYFVMDFVEGQNLREFVKVRKKLPVADAVKLMTDIVAGLAYAAQQGIFHRDLKLSNVLVTSRGTARLVDFGLYGTRSADNSSADAPTARTIDYVALERGTGVRKNDPRSDIFFAGCMLYHMITGQAPLSESDDRLQRLSISRYREIKPATEFEPTLHRSVMNVLQKSMELNADRRYQNPAEMLADLQLAMKRLDQGDNEVLGGDGGESAGPGVAGVTTTAPAPVEQEGANHSVMVVETNGDLQNIFRDKLKKHGYRVLVIGDPQRALDRFKEDQPPAQCVIFCAGAIGEPALDAFNAFAEMEQTKNTPAILLIDEDQPSFAKQAHLAPHRVLMQMPVKVKEVRAALKQLLVGK
ncbi:MAG TPA: protein kinase, partial [Pirellulaceae bacterium]|nr:protein kinase [Pirellulaceae bacterium]